MERDELMQLISSLRSEDTGDNRDEVINRISEAVNSVYDNSDRLVTANSEYVRANEQLRNANMKLFLQIGETPKPQETKQEDKPKTKLTFEELLKDEVK